MQQYVIFNVLKEYCIPKEEDSISVALFRLIAPHSGFELEFFMASVKTHLLVIKDNACCRNIV